MRSFRRLFGVFVFAVALIGCDSDQPLQVGEQTVTLQVEGGNARTTQLNVFDMFIDNDGDNVPDDGQFYTFCKTVFDPTEPDQRRKTTPLGAPVGYGVQVKLLRGGTTEAVLITDTSSSATDANLSGYDPRLIEIFAAQPPIIAGGNTFKFCQTGPFGAFPPGCRLPRQGSALVREVVTATSNPLTAIDPVTYGWGNGLCSSGDPGPDMLDGQSGPLSVQIEKGDTLIVTIRRGPLPVELVDDNGASLFISQPSLSASLTLDGNVVEPDGSSSTDATQDSTVTFSLTTQ